MSDIKRKTFQFHQEDLDWINPLILEWEEENQGRPKGELIAELLQDYRHDKETIARHKERIQRIQTQATRIATPIQSTLNPLHTALSKASHAINEKIDGLQLDAKVEAASQRIDTSLSSAFAALERLARKAIQKLKELRKKE
jgi:hypothetical protein